MHSSPLPNPSDSHWGRTSKKSTSSGNAQLARLLQLIVALQSDRCPNARELAEMCEVSRRTIYRDLETLGEAGFAVRYRTDRQGYQLIKGPSLQPPSLDEREALALVILSRPWRGGDELGLLRHARAGAIKLVHSLAPEVRSRVAARSELIPEPAITPTLPGDRPLIYEVLLDALADRLQLRIWYHEDERQPLETTKLSPYRLILAHDAWALVGRSTLHRQVRIFRIPRIRRIILTDDPYTIPPRFDLERFLAQAWARERGPDRREVWLRFSARIAPDIRDTVWHRSQRLVSLDDGRIDLHLIIDGLDEIRRWVLGFGDQVEILDPPELRDRIHEVAMRMARHHGRADPTPGLEPGRD
jgi:predicted DNA-binding transcriptional regulator YafY